MTVLSAPICDQALELRRLVERQQLSTSAPTPGRARSIAVTSGKGGVGKSHLALNLAVALAEQGCSVCLLDGNLGLGSLDLLCGVNGYWNLAHVVTGARQLEEIVLEGPGGVRLIPGASGITDLADCPTSVHEKLLEQFDELEASCDYLIIDTGSGIHRLVRQFAASSDEVLVVTTPEHTAIADAYATVKALSTIPDLAWNVVVNQVQDSEQGERIFERLRHTAGAFLQTPLRWAGAVPWDEAVPEAVARRQPFLLDHPGCPAAQAIQRMAHRFREGQPGSELGGYLRRLSGRMERRRGIEAVASVKQRT
jgi:flagellar biosynthesis protein FlhG